MTAVMQRIVMTLAALAFASSAVTAAPGPKRADSPGIDVFSVEQLGPNTFVYLASAKKGVPPDKLVKFAQLHVARLSVREKRPYYIFKPGELRVTCTPGKKKGSIENARAIIIAPFMATQEDAKELQDARRFVKANAKLKDIPATESTANYKAMLAACARGKK